MVVYNIPGRCVIDMPNDLLAELAEIDNIVAVKQARYEDLARDRRGSTCSPATTTCSPTSLDIGGTGGICVASHLVGTRDAPR